MAYSVKELFYSLQGEGANAGRAAVFCRFAGCNLWSGLERDRSAAICSFCDTDFVGTDGTGGGKYGDACELGELIANHWPSSSKQNRFVVLTGGEPLLQVDDSLIAALHERGFWIAVETNGTVSPPSGLDWICVSPKAGAQLRLTRANEIKVVVPQAGLDLHTLGELDCDHRFVQPMDGVNRDENTRWALEWCLQNPQWRLSVQSHKHLGIR